MSKKPKYKALIVQGEAPEVQDQRGATMCFVRSDYMARKIARALNAIESKKVIESTPK